MKGDKASEVNLSSIVTEAKLYTLTSRFKRSLLAVSASLLFAAFISPVLAQQPGGQNGAPTRLSDLGCGPGEVARVDADDEWDCSSALTTLENQQAVSFAVIDANGAQVGPTISVEKPTFSQPRALVLLEFSSDRRILAGVFSNRFDVQQRLFFETTDCTGASWVPLSSGFLPSISPFAAVGHEGKLEIYLPVNNVSQVIESRSQLDGSPGSILPAACISFLTITIEALQAELADPDLFTTYPPPYELVIQ